MHFAVRRQPVRKFNGASLSKTMPLDTHTLFIVATCIAGLLGLFLVAAWLQERSVRALAWWGAAYLMGASAVGLWGTQGVTPYIAISPEIPNALLFTSAGLIWSGARLFHGRPVLPGALFAGATLWVMAMQFPAFVQSMHLRVLLSSIVIATYAFFTALELRHERRKPLQSRWSTGFVPLFHAAMFLSPLPLSLFLPFGTSADGLFAFFALQTLLYVVGTAFIVVVMAKEQVATIHKTAAMTDPLSGLFNRRAFNEAAIKMMAQRGRRGQPVSVIAFDLDHFKSINDRFGHAVGDDALKLFAKTASGNMRVTDVIGRLGGEEFAAIIPGGISDAHIVAERVRAAFQNTGVVIAGHAMNATVSIGIAEATAPVTLEGLMERADAALYRAKSGGRNRVVAAEPEDIPVLAPEKAGSLVPSLRPAAALAH
jgi:diguanylate cyclase (GGDEF)-like protein